jgi:hypothetical protein
MVLQDCRVESVKTSRLILGDQVVIHAAVETLFRGK